MNNGWTDYGNTVSLANLITTAQNFSDTVTAGTGHKQYPQEKLNQLADSITKASNIVLSSSNKAEIDAMEENLYAMYKETRWSKHMNTPVYKNNLVDVLGDMKQIFIQNLISTEREADNILWAFRDMHVNGIRYPIFPKGYNPNDSLMRYMIKESTAHGFKVFANPALHAGGKRIANGILGEEGLNTSVLDNAVKTQNLIDRVKEYAIDNKCDWICPFNEDAKPGDIWSVSQINTIFSSLQNNLNGADLVGACVWGLRGSIPVLDKTDIENYITISTTHNLGFEHSKWGEFIQKSKAFDLPVWDSEANIKEPDDKTKNNRLREAIIQGVDGVVLYNSAIDLIDFNSGALKSNTSKWLTEYLDEKTNIIEEIAHIESNDFQLYPNPVSDILTIVPINEFTEYSFEVMDITGVLIQKGTLIGNSQVDFNQINPGIYFVRITQTGISYTSR
ncbi:MAG: T9SS type A sorting domain-containing protein, partial [Bacteroidales bacterium]|nr:T9SS type A sorting domain-containing protein [Bacteroidales bacterium]